MSSPLRWLLVGAAALTATALASTQTAQATGTTALISAAGDIACGTSIASYNGGNGTATQCAQKRTGNLLAGSDQVWTLGDHIYPTATTTQFAAAYDPWAPGGHPRYFSK